MKTVQWTKAKEEILKQCGDGGSSVPSSKRISCETTCIRLRVVVPWTAGNCKACSFFFFVAVETSTDNTMCRISVRRVTFAIWVRVQKRY